MKTTISIENPTQQVILALASVIAAHDEQSATSSTAEITTANGQAPEPENQQTPEPEKPKRQRRTSHSDTAEQPQTPSAQDEQPSSSEEQAATQNDVPTVVELRAKAQEVGKTSEAKKAIKALLDKFGAKSISDVAEEKRADFLSELDLI